MKHKNSFLARMHQVCFLFVLATISFAGFVLPKSVFAFPVISDVTVTNITPSSVIVQWTTDIPANSYVDSGTTTSYDRTVGYGGTRTTHSVSVGSLLPGTTYFFRVSSEDGSGEKTIDDNGGAGYTFTTENYPVISNVHIFDVGDDFVEIAWTTDKLATPSLLYGATDQYGSVIGNDSLGLSHKVRISGLTSGATYYFKPRISDVYGNIVVYSQNNIATTSAPFLENFSSELPAGTYGPQQDIVIRAQYNEPLAPASTITVRLNNNAQVALASVSGNVISGTYTVGATGSGEDTSKLFVSSIVSQDACNAVYCYSGTSLPRTNLGDTPETTYAIDTTAPMILVMGPGTGGAINSVTGENSSDIYYRLSEVFSEITLTITRTGGAEDVNAPYACSLASGYLTNNDHQFNTLDGCVGMPGGIPLVSGALYTFVYTGTDLYGNEALAQSRNNILFDTDAPSITKLTSETEDGTYGAGSIISIEAHYSEPVSGITPVPLTVRLDTGAEVNLYRSLTQAHVLAGEYVVGDVGSGENSPDLTVEAIISHAVQDSAQNPTTSSVLPVGNNLGDNHNIVIDTEGVYSAVTTQFLTDPVNIQNVDNVSIRVSVDDPSDTAYDIYYSIDDSSNPGSAPITGGPIAMEPDDSTDIQGLDLTTLSDGQVTVAVYLQKQNGEQSVQAQDSVRKDTTNPVASMGTYYRDAELTDPYENNNPRFKAGTYYFVIGFGEDIEGLPRVTIDAEGTANDLVDAEMSLFAGRTYFLPRTISFDALAVGDVLEDVSVTATDIAGNTYTTETLTYESIRSAYTDTARPQVSSGTVTPSNARTGTSVNVTVMFNEDMRIWTNPEVNLIKYNNGGQVRLISDPGFTNGFVTDREWRGSVEIQQGDSNGSASISVVSAQDDAGNLVETASVGNVFIDTIPPQVTEIDGTSDVPTKQDTIILTVFDQQPSSGVVTAKYGFSSDSTCNSQDTIETNFSDGVPFFIGGNRNDYLCARASDNAGNITYRTIGQLRIDNTAPTIVSVTSSTPDGYYKAGDSIEARVNFSEPVNTASLMTVEFETGESDGSCSFEVVGADYGVCQYEVREGDFSSDLAVSRIFGGDVSDIAGNVLSDYAPQTNLNITSTIRIDTQPPVLDIQYPLSAMVVNGDAIIQFSNDETTNPECSFNESVWSMCTNGSTTLEEISGWDTLSEGSFNFFVRDTDLAGNIGGDREEGVIKDTNSPIVENITSDKENGSYREGEVIDIDITFSRPIWGNGVVTLETGDADRICEFVAENQTQVSCDYTVQAGDASEDLSVSSVSGSVVDAIGNGLESGVPVVNLSENKDIRIDTTAPTIRSVYSNTNGVFGAGSEVTIQFEFEEIVTTQEDVIVQLNSGGSCAFSVTNSTIASCVYTVAEGENSLDLDTSSIAGGVVDRAGNGMTNFVPVFRLSENNDIIIDTTPDGPPQILRITSGKADGIYTVGEEIDIEITFTEPVSSVGGPLEVVLETGGVDRSCFFEATALTTGECVYTVQAGDSANPLTVKYVIGTLIDTVNNAMTESDKTPQPEINLGANKNIIIDTTAPSAPTITLTDPIEDANKNQVSITGNGESDTSIVYSIDDTNVLTEAKSGTATVLSDGSIQIENIDITGLDGGVITATVTLTDSAGNEGSPGTDTATSSIALPRVTNITTEPGSPDGFYSAGKYIDIRVEFSENVTSQGNATLTLETGATDRTCEFSVSDQNFAVCRYTVEEGDTSSDLDATFSGNLTDAFGNPMIIFTPSEQTLAQNRDIVVDTTAPSAPTITLTDPIEDANKNQVSITGNGESDTSIVYSIDDTNVLTEAKSGTATVLSDGSIQIENIDITGLDGGVITATVTLTDSAGNEGSPGTDTATSSIALPRVTNITTEPGSPDGFYSAGKYIDIRVEFSENVTSQGNATLTLETGATDRTCEFSVSDQNFAVCRYTVEEGDTSSDLDATFSGNLTDAFGNPMIIFTPSEQTLAQNRDIVVDTTAPNLLSFTSSNTDGTYGPREEIEIIAKYSEPLSTPSNIVLTLSTGATVTLSEVSGDELRGVYMVGEPSSGEGTNDLSVVSINSQSACDRGGSCLSDRTVPGVNISTASDIAVDAIAPVFSDVSPENSSNIGDIHDASGISFTLSEDLSQGSLVITRTAWEDDPNSPHICTFTGSALLEGTHNNFNVADCVEDDFDLVPGAVYSFRFSGIDLYGNPANEVLRTGISFGIDDNAPVISSISVSERTTSSAIITWETDENANSLIDFGETIDYGDTRGDSFARTQEHSVRITGLSPNTRYLFRVRSSDAQGNARVEDNEGNGFELVTLNIPEIQNVSAYDITKDSAKISWEISDPVYSAVSYGETTGYGTTLGREEELLDAQMVELTGLKANQMYYYRVRIRDAFGNVGFGEDLAFTTKADDSDVEPPVISDISVSEVTDVNATLVWNTNEPATSYVEYGITEEYGEIYGSESFKTSHVVTLPKALQKNTTYHFRVVSKDESGNTARSGDLTFITEEESPEVPQESAGSISGVKVSQKTSSGVTISWKTSVETNGFVRYGLTKEYGQTAGEDSTIESVEQYSKDHEIILRDLLSNSKYYFRVVSIDVAGNVLVSKESSFTTGSLSSVSGVSVSGITLNSAVIVWETADPTTSEVDYGTSTAYGRNVKNDKKTNLHKIELTNLVAGETYHFRVKGEGAGSNVVFSDDYVFATFPEPQIESYEVGEVTDESSVIRWATNVPTESSVEYWKKDDPDQKSTQGFTDLVTEHEVELGGLVQGTAYELRVKGIDTNKNTFESEIFGLETAIDLTPPEIAGVSSKATLSTQGEDAVQAIVSWKTNEPATTQLVLENTAEENGEGESSKIDENLTTNHVVVLTDLRPAMVYRFKAVSLDKNQNRGESKTFSLLTPQREKSIFELIFANFEQTFGWVKKF